MHDTTQHNGGALHRELQAAVSKMRLPPNPAGIATAQARRVREAEAMRQEFEAHIAGTASGSPSVIQGATLPPTSEAREPLEKHPPLVAALIPWNVFPWPSPDGIDSLREESDADLLEELQTLSAKCDASGELCDYTLIRDRVFLVSVALNRRGRVAPAFRELRRPPGPTVKVKGPESPERDKDGRTVRYRSMGEQALGRDRQVIDLDWISSQGHKLRVGRKHEFARLFDKAGKLDRDCAIGFVNTPASPSEKLDWLNLPSDSDLLWELDALQSTRQYDRFSNVINGGRGKDRAIGRRCYDKVLSDFLSRAGTSPKKQVNALSAARAWACGRLAEGDLERARRMHAKWMGFPELMDKRNFRRVLLKAQTDAPAPKEMRSDSLSGPRSLISPSACVTLPKTKTYAGIGFAADLAHRSAPLTDSW